MTILGLEVINLQKEDIYGTSYPKKELNFLKMNKLVFYFLKLRLSQLN